MHTAVTAFSGRTGRMIRAGTATVVASAAAVATTAVAGPLPTASAGDYGGDHDVTMRLGSRTTDELTDGNNFIRSLGRADKDVWNGTVTLSFPIRAAYRLSHDGAGTFAPQIGTNARSLAELPAAGLRQDSSRMWWR